MTTPILFKEYIWLVETIHKAGKITLAELNERWLETEMSGGVTISRTTFYKHRCDVEEMFGINIECEKRTNSYYISNEWVLYDNTVQNWLLTTFSVGNLLGDVKDLSMQSRIQLESIPSANEHLELMLEAMKRSAGRPRKENAPQPAANYRSDDAAAETFGVSGDTVRRYVRLTELIPELLDCMDRGEMALSVGEALSYLGEDMQYAVLDAIDAEGCTPSYAQAVRMKNMFRDGTLTEAAVAELLSERKANQKERISFPLDDLQRFFPPQYTPEQIRQSILRMLEEKEEREKEHRPRSREVER